MAGFEVITEVDRDASGHPAWVGWRGLSFPWFLGRESHCLV